MLELEVLYKKMYDLTNLECAKCRVPHGCCDEIYCMMAKEYALNKGVQPNQVRSKGLLFLGENGCILEPHLRPLCTIHTCKINSIGTSGNIQWDKKYWSLRNRIEELELSNGNF